MPVATRSRLASAAPSFVAEEKLQEKKKGPTGRRPLFDIG